MSAFVCSIPRVRSFVNCSRNLLSMERRRAVPSALWSATRRFCDSASNEASDGDSINKIKEIAKKLRDKHPLEDPDFVRDRKLKRFLKDLGEDSQISEDDLEIVRREWYHQFDAFRHEVAYESAANPIGVTHVEHRDPMAARLDGDDHMLDDQGRPIKLPDSGGTKGDP